MSSSVGELRALPRPDSVEGERLAELLSVVAEAPDFPTAANFFLTQLTEAAGGSRACLLVLDSRQEELHPTAVVGFDDLPANLALDVEDLNNPIVASALALVPLTCTVTAPTVGLPFGRWVSVPFPQPTFREALPLLPERKLSELNQAGCTVQVGRVVERRIGHAPCGVVIIESAAPQEVISTLSHAAMLAGPVLSRLQSLDEYRRSASRLGQQRELLTALVNSLPDPIVITDAQNDIVLQNRRAEHLLTLSEGHSEGRRRAVEINNLLFSSFLSKAAMTGGVQSGARELNLVDPDEGADLLFEVLAHPLGGEVAGEGSFVSVLRDVTDLRRAARELERQVQRVRLAEIDATRERDRLNLILENVADPILVTDDQSNIILMNQQAEQLFELGAGTATREQTSAVRGNDTKFTTFISDFTIGQEMSRREQMTLVQPSSSQELPVEVVSGKIMNPRGEPLAIVSVLHDLTKQVENERLYEELKKFSAELEERIRAATADLAEQNTRLQWQSSELEKANRLKSEFLASMSHELRTPINALIGYTSLMLDRIYGEINPKQEDGLRRIQAAAQHLLALINDILDLAKIEAGKMPLHLEEITLGQIVSEITQQMEPLVRKKALHFVCEIPSEVPPLLTDRTKVKQILLNLLSNAVKFTHKGEIVVRAHLEGQMVRIDVSDTGIGIRESDLEAIWEDFRQVDQSRTREFGGTGLGLSITRKLIDRLGGSIAVSSTYGAGSTFSVIIPLRATQRTEDSARAV